MADRLGILLPLRLETRFLPPGTSAHHPGRPDPAVDPDRWRLRLRVLPDEVSIDHHQPRPTTAEIAHVQGMWDTLRPSRLADDHAERLVAAAAHDGWADAFARVAAATGPARAHWLLANLDLATDDDGRAVVTWLDDDPRRRSHPRIVGLPRRLEVWVLWAGSVRPDTPAPIPERIATLERAPDAPPVADSLDLAHLGEEDLPDAARPWWTGWEAAERVGLAAEILLDRHPEDIEVLGVSGLGPDDGTTPQDLFLSHALAGRFGVLRPGVATSTVFGMPTVDTDATRHWSQPDATKTAPAARDVVRLLTGTDDLGPVPTDPRLGDHQLLTERIVGACYPALWGYGLSGVLNLAREAEEMGGLWDWALRHLRPEGTHPPVRIGEQVYAVLPLAVPSDDVSDGLVARPTPSWQALDSIRDVVGRMVGAWAAAARRGNDDAPAGDRLVRTLVRGPVASRLRWRQLVPVVLDAASRGDSPVGALQAWLETHRPTADLLGHTDAAGPDDAWRLFGRAYLGAPESHRLTMPLIGPGLDDPGADVDDNDVATLAEWTRPWLAEPLELDGWPIQLPQPGNDWDRRSVPSLLLTLARRSLLVSGQLLWQCGRDRPDDPFHRISLLEPLVSREATRAWTQTDAFWDSPEPGCPSLLEAASAAWAEGDEETPPLAAWRVIEACRDDPSLREIAVRALRATVEAASGRWDAWCVGIGAAHAGDALAGGAQPTLGAYGWVDAPYRGTPGPGPGGLLLAPSQAQAATLAVLRDRAVHEPDRHGMDHASDLVGPARRWLAEVAQGWHPAELAGRLLERQVEARENLSPHARQELLAALRAAAPLREGQGGFGCTHGLDVLRRAGADAGAPYDHPAVIDAAAEVSAVLQVAADLVLAEGVHGFLTARPGGRAAPVARALGGAMPMPDLSILSADRPSRSVQTCILLALPIAPVARGVGPAARANPTLDAALRHAFPRAMRWRVDLGTGARTVTPADLGFGPLDLATLDARTVSGIVGLAVAAGLGSPADEPPDDGEDPGPLLAAMSDWCGRLGGRPADVSDLRPAEAAEVPARDDHDRGQRDRDRTTDLLLVRIRSARRAALRTAARLEEACRDVLAEEEQRIAEADGPVSELPSGPVGIAEGRPLARLAVLAAGWALAPPDCAGDLVGPDDARAQRARADLTAHLLGCAASLRARVAVVDSLAPVAAFLGLDHDDDRGVAHTDPATVGAALAELVGRPRLSFGSRLPLRGLQLDPAGAALVDDWAPTVAAVRPGLGGLVVDAPDGLGLYATDPDDPWRRIGLAREWPAGRIPPSPRLTVVLAPDLPTGAGRHEWTALDAFTELVPDAEPIAGAAFDTATPSASPPQAILVAPAPVLGSGGPTDEELRSLVVYARALAHARMAQPADLAADGLGPLAAWAALPQDDHSGAPLDPAITQQFDGSPVPDLPVVLVPEHDDADDVVAAVTGDALWMLGAQWQLGEHRGEDAATPLTIESVVSHAPIGPSDVRPGRDPRLVPIEACIEGDRGEAARYPVAASGPAPSDTHWVGSRLEYDAAFPVDGPVELHVPRHAGGPAQWWAMAASGAAGPGGRTESQVARPGRLQWPGQPRGRYWHIEDPARDPAGTGPDLTQPATLHLIDLLTRHGEDLFVAPLKAHAGTILRPGPVTMVDSAGGHWILRPPTQWSLMRVAGLDPPPPDADDPDPDGTWQRALPIVLDAHGALEGPILDDVAIAVDEDDNLVWAAELVVEGSATGEASSAAPILPRPPDDGSISSASWTWGPGGRVPDQRHAFVHGSAIPGDGEGAREDRFVRTRIADPDRPGAFADPPRSELLGDVTRLEPLAVPASGIRLLRRPVLARAVDGTPVLWLQRSTRPLDVAVDVDLRWDGLRPDGPDG